MGVGGWEGKWNEPHARVVGSMAANLFFLEMIMSMFCISLFSLA